MKEVYPKYWMTAREEIYGFSQYDRSLCRYLLERIPTGEKVLEVAIGTGYPIAEFLQGASYPVYGIDISSDLVQQCRRRNPSIGCTIGDVEDLPYRSGSFDCTYCFHSTWYFPDLAKAIDEMLRVTRSPGLVIFDIQNRNAKTIAMAYRRRLHASSVTGRMVKYAKNVIKIAFRRGVPGWHSTVYEVPTFPESLYAHFAQIGVSDFHVMVREDDHSLKLRDEKRSFEQYDRLIFIVRK